MEILVFRTNVRWIFEVGRFLTVSVPSKIQEYFSKKSHIYKYTGDFLQIIYILHVFC